MQQITRFFTGMSFEFAVHPASGDGFVEINQVAVEIRSIDTGKFGFAANRQSAATAHTGAVHHDGIHADDGLHAIFLGQHAHEFHHDQRTDGNHFVVLVSALDQLLKRGGHESLFAMTSVIRHQTKLIADGTEFILKNNQILAAKTDNAVNNSAIFVQLFSYGIGNRTANAAKKE